MWKIDRKMELKIGELDALLNIIYDEKLKKIKYWCSWGFDGEVFTRVPKDITDEELINYFTKPWFQKVYLEAMNDTSRGTTETWNEKIKVCKPLEDRTEEELRTIIMKYVDEFSPLFTRPKRITIRPLTDAWGKCSKSKDKLTFDPVMKYLPEEVIEFIVYHEMIHTYCLNHNPPFQRRMEEKYPDWREWNKKLKLYWYKIRRERDIFF